MKSISYSLLFLLLFSCHSNHEKAQKNSSQSIKYAKGFSIESFEGFKKVKIHKPYKEATKEYEYVLVPKSSNTIPKHNANVQIIRTPVKRIVVTSTSHIPLLELLKEEKTLVGFPNTNFISSVKTRKLIASNKVKELGKSEAMNTELLLDLDPELVMSFSVSKPNKSLTTIQKLGVPIILNGDWLEETPLARAEWVRLFGAIYEKEEEADSIFNHIEKEYNKAKTIALEAKKTPSILSGSIFQDVWYLPAGKSFMATYFKDAHTNYLWKDTEGAGSLSLNIENVLEKGSEADFWLGCGIYSSKEQLLQTSPHYKQFEATKENSIYTYANYRGETGGMFYFELGPVRPDLILKDIIKIAHPELLPDYKAVFFTKLH